MGVLAARPMAGACQCAICYEPCVSWHVMARGHSLGLLQFYRKCTRKPWVPLANTGNYGDYSSSGYPEAPVTLPCCGKEGSTVMYCRNCMESFPQPRGGGGSRRSATMGLAPINMVLLSCNCTFYYVMDMYMVSWCM